MAKGDWSTRPRVRTCSRCGKRKSWVEFSGDRTVCHDCDRIVPAGGMGDYYFTREIRRKDDD